MPNGSLAVWCDTAAQQVAGLGPRIDLHFNMWLDLPRTATDVVLDVGILLKELRQIDQLNVYFPVRIAPEAISDLSDVLHDNSTLSAVFNSMLTVGTDCIPSDGQKRAFQVIDAGGQISFGVVYFDKERDIDIVPVKDDGGTIIRFKKPLFDALNEFTGDQYIRFRLKMNRNINNPFRDASNPSDSMLLSGFHSTDVVEFRLNERRNFSESLRKINMIFPKIETIHYFLLRDIRTELVQSHADFHKMRRLEANLWDRYLDDLGAQLPEQWIAYHWKESGKNSDGVEDFIALAFFTKPRYQLIEYIIVILLLGASGSALQDLWTLTYKSLIKVSDDAIHIQWQFLCVVGVFLFILYRISALNWRTQKRLQARNCFCSRQKRG